MNASPIETKRLLKAISNGDAKASEELFPLVYDELHRLASAYMSRERLNHTLQPTALIHEAFLRLTKPAAENSENSDVTESSTPPPDQIESVEFNDLRHFIATAALVMRRILVNHAKAKKSQKRGGQHNQLQLMDIAEAFNESAVDIVALDEALNQLAEIDETQHRLVELRFFGGMTNQQCAKLLGISERAAYYEWAHAKAWLRHQIESSD